MNWLCRLLFRRDRIAEVLQAATLDSYENELREALRLVNFLAVNDDGLPRLHMRLGVPWPRDDT